jgi:hypothetical protein
MMMKRFVAGVACSLFWIASAHAQTCTGGVSFGTAPIQVGADGSFSSNSHTFFAGAGAGNEKYFGRAGVQLSSFSAIDASAKGILGAGGAEFTVDPDKRIHVCPMVTLLHVWGPSIDVATTSTIVNAGATVGFVATKAGQATIVPTFGLSFDHISTTGTLAPPFGNGSFSYGTSYGTAYFGAGFIFNDRMALIPSVVVPFHYDAGETVFSILFATKIGQ